MVIGLVLLVVGADILVRGASGLALGFGISPLIIGLTVVAFGTSAPELAVSLQAAFDNEADLTVGNVVGSNIFNVLLILGISAVIVPLVVNQRLIRIDVPVMVGVSILVLLLSMDGSISRLEGLLLSIGILSYVGFAIYESRKESANIAKEYEEEFGDEADKQAAQKPLMNIAFLIGGLAMLVLGSRWLVDGATEIALELGLSELIVGLTIVAAGTSMPEVATSIVAALKGERDIAVGNVVGSNIFNLLAVLGFSSLITDNVAVSDAAIRFDIPVMTAVAIACIPVFFTGLIARWQGALFLAYYIAYIGYVILDASDHDALGSYSSAMLLFVLPLTAIALLVSFVRSVQMRRRADGSA